MSTLEYHQDELSIALNPVDQRHALPRLLESDQRVLDIGCGIGQSFVALNSSDNASDSKRLCIGIDIDEQAISYGIEKYGDEVQFVLADAAKIPLASDMFDLVFSRVSLPYTNIPKTIKEIARVLRKGGRIWFTIHEKPMALRYLDESLKTKNIKRICHVFYIIFNGYLLKNFGFLLPFLNKGYESWQDIPAMAKLLKKHGFEVKISGSNGHSIIEGTLISKNTHR